MKKRRLIKAILTLAVLMGILALGLFPPASAQDLTAAQVKNSKYLIPGMGGGAPDEWVQLKEGEYKRDDPDNQLFVKIVAVALGHLSNKKTKDAAVIYGFSLGGTGFFTFLCAVVNDKGQLRNSNLVDLEDRIKINSLSVKSGKIIVDMLAHGPTDPAPFPTVRKIAKYALVGDKLVEVGKGSH